MKNTPGNRRRFLHAGVRFLTLGAFAVFAAAQEFKRRRLTNDPDCIKLYTCNDCVEFSRCQLPKAENFRARYGLG